MTLSSEPDGLCKLSGSPMALIRYPRFKELHEEIGRCQALAKLANEPPCMSVDGITGAGKSTLVRDYAAAFPRCMTEAGLRIPVFYAEMPSPATVKGTVAALLEQLGDPLAGKGTLWAMNSRLMKLIRACEVELVILDEFSNLIDTETNHVLATVSDWLKMLIKQTGVPFLVVGLEGKTDRILQSNPQLSRLFGCRETLYPFAWDPHNPDTLRAFALFVQYAEKAVEISFLATLPPTELCYRIHYATDGVVGHVMNLVRYAARVAKEKGKPAIDLNDLALAFDKCLGKPLRGKTNPFVSAPNESFCPPLPQAECKSASPRTAAKRAASIATTLTSG